MTQINLFIISYELWLIIFSLVCCGLLVQDIVAHQVAKCVVIRKKVQYPRIFPVLCLSVEKMLIETPICCTNDTDMIKIYFSTRSSPTMCLMLFSNIVSMASSTPVTVVSFQLCKHTLSILPFHGISSDLVPLALNTVFQISSQFTFLVHPGLSSNYPLLKQYSLKNNINWHLSPATCFPGIILILLLNCCAFLHHQKVGSVRSQILYALFFTIVYFAPRAM